MIRLYMYKYTYRKGSFSQLVYNYFSSTVKSEKSSSYLCHSAIAAPMSNTFNFIWLDARVFEWSIVNKQNPWYQHQKIKATYKMIHPKDLKT